MSVKSVVEITFWFRGENKVVLESSLFTNKINQFSFTRTIVIYSHRIASVSAPQHLSISNDQER
jgi:hypothetical protein